MHCSVSAFTTCTKSCGTGAQSRSRAVTTRAQHGGYVCPYLAETRNCNQQACATDCITASFAAWSACTKSCATGSQKRSRTQTEPTLGGKACPHNEETRACNTFACPVDCATNAFAAWSTCTTSCGTGSQKRARTQTEPTNGGIACPHYEETRACNAHACPVDCVFFEFGSGPAAATCKAHAGSVHAFCRGASVRNYGIGVEGEFKAIKNCEWVVSKNTKLWHNCNDNSEWSACTKSCGTGSQKRIRTTTQPKYGGKACPHSAETRACNAHACATDCVTSGFGAWSACTKSCGTGSQKRSRGQSEPTFGGKACPHYTETRTCNGHSCPIN